MKFGELLLFLFPFSIQLINTVDEFDEFIVTEVKIVYSLSQKISLSHGNCTSNYLLLGCNQSLLVFIA